MFKESFSSLFSNQNAFLILVTSHLLFTNFHNNILMKMRIEDPLPLSFEQPFQGLIFFGFLLLSDAPDFVEAMTTCLRNSSVLKMSLFSKVIMDNFHKFN